MGSSEQAPAADQHRADIVIGSYRQNEAKASTHKALAEHKLPVPLDLDREVRQMAKVAQTRSPAKAYKGMVEHFHPDLISYLMGLNDD